MRYRNIKTGSIIDVPSILKGDWEPVEMPEKKEEPAQTQKKTTRRRTKKKTETAET